MGVLLSVVVRLWGWVLVVHGSMCRRTASGLLNRRALAKADLTSSSVSSEFSCRLFFFIHQEVDTNETASCMTWHVVHHRSSKPAAKTVHFCLPKGIARCQARFPPLKEFNIPCDRSWELTSCAQSQPVPGVQSSPCSFLLAVIIFVYVDRSTWN